MAYCQLSINGTLKTIKRIEVKPVSKVILLHIENDSNTEEIYKCPFSPHNCKAIGAFCVYSGNSTPWTTVEYILEEHQQPSQNIPGTDEPNYNLPPSESSTIPRSAD